MASNIIFVPKLKVIFTGGKDQLNHSTDYGSDVLVTGSHYYDERSSMFVTPPPGIQVL